MTDLTHTLTAVETDYLAECEDRIERGLQTFVEVGAALAMIRDNKLFRADHATFAEYCEKRWGFTDRRARQIIEAAEIGNMFPVENSRQAAELARVPEAERADVWAKANETTGGKLTAAAIRAAFQPSQPETPARRDPEQLPPGTSAVATPGGPAEDRPSATAEAAGQLDASDVDRVAAREADGVAPPEAAETAAGVVTNPAEADGEESSSFGSARPAAAPAPAVLSSAGAGVNPSDLVTKVLDALVPDDNPHREWQRHFFSDIHALYRVTRNEPEVVAETADSQCVEELGRALDLLVDYRARVLAALKASLPDNVRQMRRIS
jgi:hypothetical protein